jgi:diaminopimelate decarboxylase
MLQAFSYASAIRYAMKALPNASILRFFDKKGFHFDCGSTQEVARCLLSKIAGYKIELVSQEVTA